MFLSKETKCTRSAIAGLDVTGELEGEGSNSSKPSEGEGGEATQPNHQKERELTQLHRSGVVLDIGTPQETT